jgi:Flp pilus assembly protein CpaB
MSSFARTLPAAVRRARRGVLRRRRLLAFVLTALAALLALHALRPPDPPTSPLTVAARDLAAGEVVAAADLRVEEVPAGDLPDGVVADPVGRMLATAVRRGEAVTDVRVVGPALTAGDPTAVAVPVRFPDAGMVGLLRVGDEVRILATDPSGGRTRVVADEVRVLALPRDGPVGAGEAAGTAGRLAVLGVDPAAVEGVVSASTQGFLTFAFER